MSSMGAVLTVDSEVEGGALLHLYLVGSCAGDGTGQLCPVDVFNCQRAERFVLWYAPKDEQCQLLCRLPH